MEMTLFLESSLGRFVTALLIFSRIGGVLASAPLLSGRGVPTPVRSGLAALVAALLAPLYPAARFENLPLLGAALVKETLVGLALGWLASTLFSAVQMAGEWLDVQAGFQAAQLFNPLFHASQGPLGTLKYLLAGLIFVGVGGPGIVLTAAAQSFQVSPPGAFTVGVGGVDDWFGFLGRSLWIAIQLAAPVGTVLFLAELGLAVLNRTLPQLNVLMLSLPAKGLLAVIVLSTSVPLLGNALANVFGGFGESLAAGVRLMGGR